MEYLISIIIPVYNGENYIRNTIEQIERSSYKNIEIVAVNDGSTDNSLLILSELKKKDDRITIVNKTNGGIISARNSGIKAAHGDYICFCDQDDFVDINMYSTMVHDLIVNGADMAICAHNTQYSDIKIIQATSIKERKCLEQDEIVKQLLIPLVIKNSKTYKGAVSGWYGTIWNCMFSRKMIEDNHIHFKRFLDYEDDYLFAIDSMIASQKICLCPKAYYTWSYNADSESHKDRKKYTEDFSDRVMQLNEYIKERFVMAGIDYAYSEEWKNYIGCQSFIRVLRNECSDKNPKSCREKINYLKEYIKSEQIKNSLDKYKDYSNSRKSRIVLGCFKYKFICVGYIINKYFFYLNV